jgi:hydrogenase maturation protease
VNQRVLVAGIGNIFLSDDGFGPEVVAQLCAPGQEPLPECVRVVDYGIRGMHLTYDLLDGYDGLVLVDALPFDGSPGELRVLEVGPDDVGHSELDAHGMDPVAVLSGVQALGGTLPPTYVVGCCPATVEDGIGLSGPVAAAIPGAVAMVRDVVEHARASTEPGRPVGPVETGRR